MSFHWFVWDEITYENKQRHIKTSDGQSSMKINKDFISTKTTLVINVVMSFVFSANGISNTNKIKHLCLRMVQYLISTALCVSLPKHLVLVLLCAVYLQSVADHASLQHHKLCITLYGSSITVFVFTSIYLIRQMPHSLAFRISCECQIYQFLCIHEISNLFKIVLFVSIFINFLVTCVQFVIPSIRLQNQCCLKSPLNLHGNYSYAIIFFVCNEYFFLFLNTVFSF